MSTYTCNICDYKYDPEIGDADSNISPGTAWEDVPAEWLCPTCGAPKSEFFKTNKE